MENFKKYFICRGVGGLYLLADEDGATMAAKPRGVFRNQGLKPCPGDFVYCQLSGDEDVPLWITEILPRKNHFIRPTVANIDILLIVVALTQPDPDPYLIDKLLIVACAHDVQPVICFTKNDLADSSALSLYNLYHSLGIPCFRSGLDDIGSCVQSLQEQFRGLNLALAGQSGVGKSTLINALLHKEVMPVGEVGDRSLRGKHTTRHVEFFAWKGGFLADTPGFSSLELKDLGLGEDDVIDGYPEIAALAEACRFASCRHLVEKDCAVLTARGIKIAEERYLRYAHFRQELLKENRY